MGAKEIHIWSGFPCADFTAVKAFRERLAGEQSRLLYEVPRIIKVVKEESGEDITVKFVGETVASMGKAECTEITTTLGVWPCHLNPAQAVPMNRPGLCWCSEELEGVVDGLSFNEEEFWTTVTAPARYPEVRQWLEEGAFWEGAEQGTIFPTCLRAIVRHRPPTRPAGVNRCDDDTLARWTSENFKFPPYHYLSQYLIWKGNKWRLTDSTERELLLGYGFGHTRLAWSESQIKQSAAKFENTRLSLLGDCFSIYSFVLPAAALCKSFLPKLHYEHLAPGFRAPWRVSAPLKRGLAYCDLGKRAEVIHSPGILNRILLTKVNHTGSDIRITSGEVMNYPQAHPRQSVEAAWWDWEHVYKFKWERREHTNSLELRAIHRAVLHAISHHKLVDARLFHVTDSYVCMSIIGKVEVAAVS